MGALGTLTSVTVLALLLGCCDGKAVAPVDSQKPLPPSDIHLPVSSNEAIPGNKLNADLNNFTIFNEQYAYFWTEGNDWGNWGHWERCPAHTYPKGISVRYEPSVGDGNDDTTLNSVYLYCGALGEDSIEAQGRRISSLQGPFGHQYSPITWCPENGFIIGLQAKIEESCGDCDDTSMNQLKVLCSGGTTSNNVGGNDWGTWRQMKRCPSGWLPTWLVTQVEPSIDGDDTAMNNIKIACERPEYPGIPEDAWELVLACQNDNNPNGIECSYDKTVGTKLVTTSTTGQTKEHSWSNTLGSELSASFRGIIGAKFSASTTWSSTTGYSWSTSRSSWSSESTTTRVSTDKIPAGKTAMVYQVRGTCGGAFQVFAPYFRVHLVDTKTYKSLKPFGDAVIRKYAFSQSE